MTEATPVPVPLVNPNELEATLVDLLVSNGDKVAAGDVLATIETTKSTQEVTAEHAGYVVGLQAAAGDSLRAGEVLLWLSPSADWRPPQAAVEEKASSLPDGLRLTAPAQARADSAGIDLAQLPHGPLITLEWLEAWMTEADELAPIDPSKIIVYGGGGHGKAVLDLLAALGRFEVVGIVDDGLASGEQVMGVAIVGGKEQLAGLRAEGVGQAVNAVGGIGDIGSRVGVFELLQAAGFESPAVVHPQAFVEASAVVAEGVQVFPHAYVGSEADIGFGAIVNTGAIVSHDCVLAHYANIAPGAKLAGAVHIGQAALIGMGVTVNLNVRIGEGARIGNSAVVKRDVPANGIVPAGTIWPPPETS